MDHGVKFGGCINLTLKEAQKVTMPKSAQHKFEGGKGKQMKKAIEKKKDERIARRAIRKYKKEQDDSNKGSNCDHSES